MERIYVSHKNRILVKAAAKDCARHLDGQVDVNRIVNYLTSTSKSMNCTRLSDKALRQLAKLDAGFITDVVQSTIDQL